MTFVAEEPISPRYRGAVQMDDAVFRKTVAGRAEVERTAPLADPALRRMLHMIDGERTLAGLRPFFRPAEADTLVAELLHRALIEALPGHAPTTPVVDASDTPRRSLSVMQFEAARRAAMRTTTELLGDAALPYIAGLVHCQDSDMLRSVIDGIKAEVSKRCSPGAARLLVETVRAAARLDG